MSTQLSIYQMRGIGLDLARRIRTEQGQMVVFFEACLHEEHANAECEMYLLQDPELMCTFGIKHAEGFWIVLGMYEGTRGENA